MLTIIISLSCLNLWITLPRSSLSPLILDPDPLKDVPVFVRHSLRRLSFSTPPFDLAHRYAARSIHDSHKLRREVVKVVLFFDRHAFFCVVVVAL
jgi:hypothetical protein